jgi:hypothetical protein
VKPTPEKVKQSRPARPRIETSVRDEDSEGEGVQEDEVGSPTRGGTAGTSAGGSPERWENFERVSSSAGGSALNESASMSSSFKRKGIMSMMPGSDKR